MAHKHLGLLEALRDLEVGVLLFLGVHLDPAQDVHLLRPAEAPDALLHQHTVHLILLRQPELEDQVVPVVDQLRAFLLLIPKHLICNELHVPVLVAVGLNENLLGEDLIQLSREHDDAVVLGHIPV